MCKSAQAFRRSQIFRSGTLRCYWSFAASRMLTFGVLDPCGRSRLLACTFRRFAFPSSRRCLLWLSRFSPFGVSAWTVFACHRICLLAPLCVDAFPPAGASGLRSGWRLLAWRLAFSFFFFSRVAAVGGVLLCAARFSRHYPHIYVETIVMGTYPVTVD